MGFKHVIPHSIERIYKSEEPIGTDETGKISYFNDYGRTK
jgi:hypothetical protein